MTRPTHEADAAQADLPATGHDQEAGRPAARRSHALEGRERIKPTRPDWAGTVLPDGAVPLPLLAANALASPGTSAATERIATMDRSHNGAAWSPEMAALRERGAAIRRETLADLEGHLRALTAQVEANGGVVHRVRTPEQAVRVVSDIAHANGVKLAVKSKSMASEEMHLNHHLNDEGIEVVETDLGEYIAQLADERPSHIVAPIVHKSQQDVTRLFSELAGEEVPDDPRRLAGFARERLREDFHSADMGITGVNFAAADTGTLALVTNEGNARMVTSQPRVHVAVMTVEKVIPRFTDLAVLLPLLCHAATKQTLSVYQTLITGPRRDGERDGAEQLHLVIMDNGRSELVGTAYQDVLACIRCGACQVACPVYRTVGGHGYGAVYGGPIGAVLTPLLGDRERSQDLPFLSSLCGKCYDVCPVKIPLPDMLVDLRADYEAGAGRSRTRRWLWRTWAGAWSRPWAYRLTVTAARAVSPLARTDLVARLPVPGAAWARGREVPSLAEAGSFRRWFATRRRRR